MYSMNSGPNGPKIRSYSYFFCKSDKNIFDMLLYAVTKRHDDKKKYHWNMTNKFCCSFFWNSFFCFTSKSYSKIWNNFERCLCVTKIWVYCRLSTWCSTFFLCGRSSQIIIILNILTRANYEEIFLLTTLHKISILRIHIKQDKTDNEFCLFQKCGFTEINLKT